MTKLSRWKMVCTISLLLAATAITSPAQTFTTLVNFGGPNGGDPRYMSLIQGADGNLYGTTHDGGRYNHGTVFRTTRVGKLTFYSFCSQMNCADGAGPPAGLVLAPDGGFYGTTSSGGAGGYGTVFKITPRGALTTLHSFNNADGAIPSAGLLQTANGNFYGTTSAGGGSSACRGGCGTVFELTPNGALTTLHSFDSDDGANPIGTLVQATDGFLYGITEDGAGGDCTDGPTVGCGTVFRITEGGTLTTLYRFCAQPDCTDGGFPLGGLIQATDGNIYGTTEVGGAFTCALAGCGTVFKITPEGTLTTLYNFCSQPTCTDGYFPVSGLVQGTDGSLYGMTSYGGTYQVWGTIFEITPTGLLATLHNFDLDDGADPSGGLLQATDGSFYGTTPEGGSRGCDVGCGTVFRFDTSLGPFVSFVRAAGRIGQAGGILGQGFTGTTSVSLNGTPATFVVKSDTFLEATVPAGATTGYVTVTTPSGTLTSNVPFHVIQ